MITTAIITSIIVTMGLGFSGDEKGHYLETIKHWNIAVIEYIEDEDREDKALDIVVALANTLKQTHKETYPVFQQFMVVDRDYDSTMEDYQAVLLPLITLWRKNDMQMLELRAELKETLTDEEWQLCLGYVQKKMSEIRKKTEKKVAEDKKTRAKRLDKLN
jgi:hypothetical protein